MSSTAVPNRAKSSKRVLPLEEARERMRDLRMTEPDGAAEPADYLTWGGMASKALVRPSPTASGFCFVC